MLRGKAMIRMCFVDWQMGEISAGHGVRDEHEARRETPGFAVVCLGDMVKKRLDAQNILDIARFYGMRRREIYARSILN